MDGRSGLGRRALACATRLGAALARTLVERGERGGVDALERGADEEIGFKLKSVEWDGGNSTGFSALSNGWRWTGVFAYPEYTNFWTSTQISPEVSWARILREGESGIARQPYYPHFGKSVRCVQESE